MRKKYRDKFTNPEIVKRIEQIENSPQMQSKLHSVKNGMKDNIINPFLVIGAMVGFIALRAMLGIYSILVMAALVYFWNKYSKQRRTELATSYTDNFLLPVLNEILPDTTIDYSKKVDVKVMQRLVPNSEYYFGNCHIVFGDDYKTEFSNMQAYTETEDSEGHTRQTIDFCGQVLMAKFDTKINGHIRVVPIKKGKVLGFRNHGSYGRKTKIEKEIETESIEFNNSYAIYSTDDFYTRLILDPKIIELLNDWKEKMRVCLYMNEQYISVSFESNAFLFALPQTKKQVDELSLSTEYEKVREKLSGFYSLIDIIGEKL
ncbi:MAG: DUF3137 domain-containing protein [Finegoldia sp.]|uniref:DUF3137 domain-containing protein n=1 Tax=Finegoldia TaxID=150022 RepID=UPI0025FE0328|nr:DUF3137 domain-containing protein [Finegoldia magna]MDU1832816.1 DUF3137 domain-containing protein [Finegoldia magna]MDU1878079.1 DUF3137 domain-containing protein [Finegoldia magna]MDU2575063.1 DUF3137 domain-containing protein [Finegoldia magna]